MHKSTGFARNEDFAEGGKYEKKWRVIDAGGLVLGRLSSEVAKVLRGKNKAIFTPHVDTGDYVIVINADKVVLTGKKWKEKMYYRHTGYQGGLKTASAEELKEKNPCLLVHNAVKGMLPKSPLGRKTLHKLRVYSGAEHPHAANKPEVMTLPEKITIDPA